MKILIVALLLSTTSAFAKDHCAKYQKYPRHLTAIEAVANQLGMKMTDLCSSEAAWDIESQPTRQYTREGEMIPFTRVQIHFEFDSCLYMVNDLTLEVSQKKCYSGF